MKLPKCYNLYCRSKNLGSVALTEVTHVFPFQFRAIEQFAYIKISP